MSYLVNCIIFDEINVLMFNIVLEKVILWFFRKKKLYLKKKYLFWFVCSDKKYIKN